jgi:hypothetical protein
MGARMTAISAGIVAAVLWMAAPALAAPANDDFAAAQDLGEGLPLVVPGSNLAATEESGEDVGAFAAGHSVWFRWKAPSTGFVTVGACGSAFSAVVGVFAGVGLESLTKVAGGNASEGPHCPLTEREYTFKATEDTTYSIAVDGNTTTVPGGPPAATQGQIELRIEATPPPVNDDFDGATPLVGSVSEEAERGFYTAHAFGYNWGAGKEAFEPAHGGDQGGASVWYSWIAPQTGTAQVGVCCGSLSLLGVYIGGAVGALAKVDLSSAFGTFPVVAGTTYRLAVDGKYEIVAGAARVGSFNLTVSMDLPPAGPLPSTDPPAAATAAAANATTSESAVPVRPDTTSPRTILDSRRVRSSARSATFGFHTDEAGSGFRCALDNRKAAPCRAPKSYSSLTPGPHVFEVYAVDRAGNADPTAATARFAIAAAKRKHARGSDG